MTDDGKIYHGYRISSEYDDLYLFPLGDDDNGNELLIIHRPQEGSGGGVIGLRTSIQLGVGQ